MNRCQFVEDHQRRHGVKRLCDVGDITFLPVSGSKPLYLATVIDLASRRLAGWAIAAHMRAELVIDALATAERTRGSLAGAIMHTDHGSQGGFNWSSQHLVRMEVLGWCVVSRQRTGRCVRS
ncbi:DDE-type integrase/transposase/recombinase [Streptomyces goshikiensis]|uniref:DDE-type integrase/transposase/recombinase n=1 Tax=Streptomyces goshikiensis TaxID=1942 RepID=UPI00371B3BC1